MRIGIVALQHETNTFIRTPTDLAAFRGGLLATGDEFRDAVEGSNHELAGFFAGLDEAGVAAVPLFGARALPYGLISDDAYAELKRRLLAEIMGHLPLDGLLLAPHRAGVSEAARDPGRRLAASGSHACGAAGAYRRNRRPARQPLSAHGRRGRRDHRLRHQPARGTSASAAWKRRACSSTGCTARSRPRWPRCFHRWGSASTSSAPTKRRWRRSWSASMPSGNAGRSSLPASGRDSPTPTSRRWAPR